MIRALQFIIGLGILLSVEILRVYYIMPFPGSQRAETVDFAYFLHGNIMYFRLVGFLFIVFPVLQFFLFGSKREKWGVVLALTLYAVVFYLFNFQFVADKMFYQPEHKIFKQVSTNGIPQQDLVVGITLNGESKAYPIELIGYHHQVRDTVGDEPVMVTYCTVCRTGRIFKPVVNGKPENFRLVGMDHFNAMFEDETTGSWWQQATGEAVTGPLKGTVLAEVLSEQMSLQAWISRHPDTWILQPDSIFSEEYKGLKNYDEGKSKGPLTRRDSLSWNDKSWVVGVQVGRSARAYDWNDLATSRVLNDTLGGTALVVAIEGDSSSFHVWRRDTLRFTIEPLQDVLKDIQTHSTWNWKGECTEGPLKGASLPVVQSYQEFWHSWSTFHPQTTKFTGSR
jgi:hypothetical protein